MHSRRVLIATLLGSLMLLGMAILHASGYGYVSSTLTEAELPAFIQQVLPVLFLYPSVIIAALAVAALASLRSSAAAPFVLAAIAVLVFAHAALGFALGGALPGIVVGVAGCMFAVAAYASARDHRDSTS